MKYQEVFICLGATGILGLQHRVSFLLQDLDEPRARYPGRIPYSLYLTQATILFGLTYLLWGAAGLHWIYTAMALLVGTLFWKLVKDPAIQAGPRLERREHKQGHVDPERHGVPLPCPREIAHVTSRFPHLQLRHGARSPTALNRKQCREATLGARAAMSQSFSPTKRIHAGRLQVIRTLGAPVVVEDMALRRSLYVVELAAPDSTYDKHNKHA